MITNTDKIAALPEWSAYKFVKAARIAFVVAPCTAGWRLWSLVLALPDGTSTEVEITTEFAREHNPEPGGYFTLDHAGKCGYIPGRVFEAEFTAGVMGPSLIGYAVTSALQNLRDPRIESTLVNVYREPKEGLLPVYSMEATS